MPLCAYLWLNPQVQADLCRTEEAGIWVVHLMAQSKMVLFRTLAHGTNLL
jgi:hypothetical protein